ncbi:hypothetical protein NL676_034237 [Syzygium grande]|nr:hypothetical protein NL676_034237 [Syzygium grande]
MSDRSDNSKLAQVENQYEGDYYLVSFSQSPLSIGVCVHACKEDFKYGFLLEEFWSLIKNPDVPVPSKGDHH